MNRCPHAWCSSLSSSQRAFAVCPAFLSPLYWTLFNKCKQCFREDIRSGNKRRSKHKLMVNRPVHQNYKTRKTNLRRLTTQCFWIYVCLALYKANIALMTFTKNSSHHQMWNIPHLMHCPYHKDQSGVTISHFLSIDDIMLYDRSDWNTDSLIHLTRIYSEDARMSFFINVAKRL